MKNTIKIKSKLGRYLSILLLGLAFSNVALSADLIVTGITNPSTANGTYVQQADLFTYKSWKLVNGANTYFIYNDDYNSERYWNIDDNTNDMDDAFFYSSNPSTLSSPAGITSWGSFNGGAGTPVIVEAGAPLAPEIEIRGNALEIAKEDITPDFTDHTKFGSVNVNAGTATRTFTIHNLGSAALTISNASISGTNASDFTITTAPSSSVASAANTSFVVTFNPSASGDRTAMVTITNNDADEMSYTFSIHGSGILPGNITVSGITSPAVANGLYIYQGVINNYEYWKHETQNYYVFNKDQTHRYWNIDANLIDTDNDFLFYIKSENVTPVSLTGWTKNTNAGHLSEGSPFITLGTPLPEVDLKGNGKSIADEDITPSMADYTNFGAVNVQSGDRKRIFTIENLGNTSLNLTGNPKVTITGADAADFTVSIQPAVGSIPTTSSTTFELTFNPSTLGTKTATVNIGCDDGDEANYNFAIEGYGISPKNMTVSGITTPAQANGTYIYQGIMYDMPYWKQASANYYIYNNQYLTDGRYWNIDIDTDIASSNFYSTAVSENVSPIVVPAWTAEVGSAGIPILSFIEPEISVEGNNVVINDGDTSPSITNKTDFGALVIVGASTNNTYTIKNIGAGDLYLVGSPIISISGTNASDFTVTTQPSTGTILPASNTTFVIKFDPSATGIRTATVHIANSDANESVYSFSIKGEGMEAPTVSTQSVTAVSSNSATLHGTIVTLGVPNPTDHGFCWNTSGTPTTSDNKSTKGASSNTGTFTSDISNLSVSTKYYVRAYAISNSGIVYGNEVFFTTSTPTGLEATAETSSYTLYPNPTSSGFYIEGNDGAVQLNMYNLAGQRVLSKQVSTKDYIDISSLSNGTYIVSINGERLKLVKH